MQAGIDRVSLLVIPNHHHVAPIDRDGPFCDWLRAASRHAEVVLHGYFHQRPASPGGWRQRLITEHYTAGEGEFYDLTEGEAACRLAMGTQALAAIGLFPRGFIAPAWLLGAEAEVAVRKAGFDYTHKTVAAFKDLRTGRETSSQSLRMERALRMAPDGRAYGGTPCWRALCASAGCCESACILPIGTTGRFEGRWRGLIRDALATREAITYEDWLARLALRAMNSAKSTADLHIHSRHSTALRTGSSGDWSFRASYFGSASDLSGASVRDRDAILSPLRITTLMAGCLEIAHLPE